VGRKNAINAGAPWHARALGRVLENGNLYITSAASISPKLCLVPPRRVFTALPRGSSSPYAHAASARAICGTYALVGVAARVSKHSRQASK